MKITFHDSIRKAAPNLRVLTIEALVSNPDTPDSLWSLLEREGVDARSRWQMPDINRRPAIAATRAAYKALGKEPNRYRPSAEALCRRLVKGMDLYRLTALVDLINLLSIRSGYSIGGFDADRIDGNELVLGVGQKNEEFEAIGRGQLNIEGMPVYRDRKGGIGTPTSDNVRTMLTPQTKRLLMCINIYGEEMPVDATVSLAVDLLTRYAGATSLSVNMHTPDETA